MILIKKEMPMSDYATKLASLAEKKQRLIIEENKLIQQRKIHIAELAERFGLLTLDDVILVDAFTKIAETNQTESKDYLSQEKIPSKNKKSTITTSSIISSSTQTS